VLPSPLVTLLLCYSNYESCQGISFPYVTFPHHCSIYWHPRLSQPATGLAIVSASRQYYGYCRKLPLPLASSRYCTEAKFLEIVVLSVPYSFHEFALMSNISVEGSKNLLVKFQVHQNLPCRIQRLPFL